MGRIRIDSEGQEMRMQDAHSEARGRDYLPTIRFGDHIVNLFVSAGIERIRKLWTEKIIRGERKKF